MCCVGFKMTNAATATEIGDQPGGRADELACGNRPRRSREVSVDIVAIAEAISVSMGCLLPAYIYAHEAGITINWFTTLQVGLVAAIIVHLCLRAWGMYDTMRMDAFPQRPLSLAAALVAACIAIAGLGLPIPARQPHVSVWYATWIALSFTLMVLIRMIAGEAFRRMTAEGVFDVRIAVFGAGSAARRVRDHIVQARNGVHFVGAFDDRTQAGRLNAEGVVVSGGLDELVALGRAEGVDRIVVALPGSASARIDHVIRKLDQLPVSIHVVTHIASDLVSMAPAHKVSAIGPIGLLDVKRAPLADWAPYVKRLEDVILGGLMLLISLPLMALIAIAIKLESRGPVLFVQRRRGLNQRIIPVMKFRTMRVLEDGFEIKQATEGDPRVTRLGRFLRRSSLDELPQIFNVLKGEMSLVGPRPHAVAHDDHYGGVLVGYVNRHQVKPGITGLAQVRGLRGETRTDDKMQSRVDTDLEYINAWSPWLDLKILGRTIVAVVRGCNAH